MPEKRNAQSVPVRIGRVHGSAVVCNECERSPATLPAICVDGHDMLPWTSCLLLVGDHAMVMPRWQARVHRLCTHSSPPFPPLQEEHDGDTVRQRGECYRCIALYEVQARSRMGLDDFDVIQSLGKGAFARVDKVRGEWPRAMGEGDGEEKFTSGRRRRVRLFAS